MKEQGETRTFKLIEMRRLSWEIPAQEAHSSSGLGWLESDGRSSLGVRVISWGPLSCWCGPAWKRRDQRERLCGPETYSIRCLSFHIAFNTPASGSEGGLCYGGEPRRSLAFEWCIFLLLTWGFWYFFNEWWKSKDLDHGSTGRTF